MTRGPGHRGTAGRNARAAGLVSRRSQEIHLEGLQQGLQQPGAEDRRAALQLAGVGFESLALASQRFVVKVQAPCAAPGQARVTGKGPVPRPDRSLEMPGAALCRQLRTGEPDLFVIAMAVLSPGTDQSITRAQQGAQRVAKRCCGDAAIGQSQASPLPLAEIDAEAGEGAAAFDDSCLPQRVCCPVCGTGMAGFAIRHGNQQARAVLCRQAGKKPSAAQYFIVRMRGDDDQSAPRRHQFFAAEARQSFELDA